MTRYAKHSAVFFLFIFTAYLVSGNVLKGLSYNALNSGPNQSDWTATCNNSSHSLHFSQGEDRFTTAEELPSGNEQPAEIINCNSSLHILPAFNTFLFKPGQAERPIQQYTSFLFSQSYIYQEPDPPRLS